MRVAAIFTSFVTWFASPAAEPAAAPAEVACVAWDCVGSRSGAWVCNCMEWGAQS